MVNLTIDVGDTIDARYRVERILGRGGMGVVVAVRHLRLGTSAAIKFPLAHLGSRSDVVERLIREARIAMQLRSEHVARVYDIGVHDRGGPYLVMEFLFGQDLGRKLEQEGPLSRELAIECILQTCEALAEAHASCVVHRDLKPSNLFLSKRPDGSPFIKVIDFGLAKDLDPEQLTTLTNSGALLGSLPFMAPEQMRGAGAVDARSDVYALGATLYALLTGRPPFSGKSVLDVYDQVVAGAPPVFVPGATVPPALERAIQRCLHVAPERRFETIAAFAEALTPLAPRHAEVHAQRARATLRIAARRKLADGVGAPSPAVRAEPQLRAHGTDSSLSTTLGNSDAAVRVKSARSLAWVITTSLVLSLAALGFRVVVATVPHDASAKPSSWRADAAQQSFELAAIPPVAATRLPSAEHGTHVSQTTQSSPPRRERDAAVIMRKLAGPPVAQKLPTAPTASQGEPDPLADPN
jgi:serine/threonine protein kinase